MHTTRKGFDYNAADAADSLVACNTLFTEITHTPLDDACVKDIFEYSSPARKKLERVVNAIMNDPHLVDTSISGRSTGAMKTKDIWSEGRLYFKRRNIHLGQFYEFTARYLNDHLAADARLCAMVAVGRTLILEYAPGMKLAEKMTAGTVMDAQITQHLALIKTYYALVPNLLEKYRTIATQYFPQVSFDTLFKKEDIKLKLAATVRGISGSLAISIPQPAIDRALAYYLENRTVPFLDSSPTNTKIDPLTNSLKVYDIRIHQLTMPLREFVQVISYTPNFREYTATHLQLKDEDHEPLEYALLYYNLRSLYLSLKYREQNIIHQCRNNLSLLHYTTPIPLIAEITAGFSEKK